MAGRRKTFTVAAVLMLLTVRVASAQPGQIGGNDGESLRQKREAFQAQQLMTAAPLSWVFQPGDTPRIVWRDVERVRALGFHQPLRVRWFNGDLQEFDSPDAPGRWAAWMEGTAPNGTAFRRALTFYALPKQPEFFAPQVSVTLPDLPDTPAGRVWGEHEEEFNRVAKSVLGEALMSDQRSAILLAGLAESEPLGRPARFIESTTVRNMDFHLALKLKLTGLGDQTQPLPAPRERTVPAPELRQGSAVQAGVVADAEQQLDAVCRDWYQDTGEPFVTLVARRGVIVLHRAYGQGTDGRPVTRDDRCWVASITKTVTALTFARFVDAGRVALDDSLSSVFPHYPREDPHVPTFRQCLNHTSGLTGGTGVGGIEDPHLENVVLNGIDVNQPNSQYRYSGLGFELTAKALELLTGLSAPRICERHLFRPLDFGDVVMGNASSDGHFTAWELGVLAQLIANQGSYGDRELFSPATFEQLLPRPLTVPGHEDTQEGIGLHWRLQDIDGYSDRTVGHGSFSGCLFTIDLDRQLVVVQVRGNRGERHGDWSQKLFAAASRVVVEE